MPEIEWAGLVGVRGAKSSGAPEGKISLPRALELECERCLGGLGLCVVIMACSSRTCLLRITSPSLLIQPNLRSYSFQLSIPPRHAPSPYYLFLVGLLVPALGLSGLMRSYDLVFCGACILRSCLSLYGRVSGLLLLWRLLDKAFRSIYIVNK